MIKIKKAQAFQNRMIHVEYVDGVKGSFNFEDYFNYDGAFKQLKDPVFFSQMFYVNNTLEWPGEVDLCPDIIRAIITQKKITYEDKVVFDPSLKGKSAWCS